MKVLSIAITLLVVTGSTSLAEETGEMEIIISRLQGLYEDAIETQERMQEIRSSIDDSLPPSQDYLVDTTIDHTITFQKIIANSVTILDLARVAMLSERPPDVFVPCFTLTYNCLTLESIVEYLDFGMERIHHPEFAEKTERIRKGVENGVTLLRRSVVLLSEPGKHEE